MERGIGLWKLASLGSEKEMDSSSRCDLGGVGKVSNITGLLPWRRKRMETLTIRRKYQCSDG